MLALGIILLVIGSIATLLGIVASTPIASFVLSLLGFSSSVLLIVGLIMAAIGIVLIVVAKKNATSN